MHLGVNLRKAQNTGTQTYENNLSLQQDPSLTYEPQDIFSLSSCAVNSTKFINYQEPQLIGTMSWNRIELQCLFQKHVYIQALSLIFVTNIHTHT